MPLVIVEPGPMRKTSSPTLHTRLYAPVWVPYSKDELLKKSKQPARNRRDDTPGPNGEPADSGKWRLKIPGTNGKIHSGPTISPSALETATDCMHAWGLSRLDNLEKPSKPSSDLGTARHLELQNWLQHTQKPTTEGMAKVLAHFPMPGQCESEVYQGYEIATGGRSVVFAGWLDAREPGVIRDLKTTGDWKWVKTPAELRANLQACIYGLGEMLRQSSDSVVLKWTYALLDKKTGAVKKVGTVCDRAGGPVVDPVDAEGVLLTRTQATAVIAQYVPKALEMLDVIAEHEQSEFYGTSTALSAARSDERAGYYSARLAKTASACELYGGCSWKKSGACEVPVGGGFRALMRQERELQKIGVPDANTRAARVDREIKTLNGVGKSGGSMGGLGARFAKQLGAGGGAVSEPAKGAVVKAALVEKPKSTPVAAAASKVEQRAQTNGMASSGGAVSTGGGSLMSRLKGIVAAKNGNSVGGVGGVGGVAAVEKALDAAPSVAVGAVAKGINPPDAAPEWTQEEQAAESARITTGGKAAKDKKGAEALVAAKVAAGVIEAPAEVVEVVQAVEAGETPVEEPKRGRGRPKGSTKAVSVDEDTSGPGALTLEEAQQQIDRIVTGLMLGGYRKAAAQLLSVELL